MAEQQPQDHPEGTPLGDVISAYILPAADAGQAQHMWTTQQVHAMVDEHAPGAHPIESVREELIKLGFKELLVEDQFFWLIRSR